MRIMETSFHSLAGGGTENISVQRKFGMIMAKPLTALTPR